MSDKETECIDSLVLVVLGSVAILLSGMIEVIDFTSVNEEKMFGLLFFGSDLVLSDLLRPDLVELRVQFFSVQSFHDFLTLLVPVFRQQPDACAFHEIGTLDEAFEIDGTLSLAIWFASH